MHPHKGNSLHVQDLARNRQNMLNIFFISVWHVITGDSSASSDVGLVHSVTASNVRVLPSSLSTSQWFNGGSSFSVNNLQPSPHPHYGTCG